MKLNRVHIILLFVLYFLLSCLGKSHNKIEEIQTKDIRLLVEENSFKSDSLDSLFFTDVQYINKAIYVYKKENIITKVPYNYDEQVLPVKGLVISDDTIIRNYYIYNNNILLIPVNEVNNRMNLVVVNLKEKKYLKYNHDNYLIPTSINWFYFDVKTGILIGSNQINPDGKTMIHFYSITDKEIKLLKSESVFLDERICQDYARFKKTIFP